MMSDQHDFIWQVTSEKIESEVKTYFVSISFQSIDRQVWFVKLSSYCYQTDCVSTCSRL